MSTHPARLVQRYLPAQRAIHWIGVATFMCLLLSGIVLMVRPLGLLAAGGASRYLHRVAAVPFMALPIAYALLLPHEARDLVLESIHYRRNDWLWLLRMPSYVLGRTRGLPPQGRLNAGQKLHHAGTFLSFVTVSVSGLVLWIGKGHLGGPGLAATAIFHDLSMMMLTVLLVGHVYFTFVYGAFDAMRTGYVTEEYARTEHREWLETLPPSSFATEDSARGSNAARKVRPDPHS